MKNNQATDLEGKKEGLHVLYRLFGMSFAVLTSEKKVSCSVSFVQQEH